jgi:hypothetical protein
MQHTSTNFSVDSSGRAQGQLSGSQKQIQKPINYNLLGGFEIKKNDSKRGSGRGTPIDLGQGHCMNAGNQISADGRLGKHHSRNSMPVNVFTKELPSSRFDKVTNVHNTLADKRRKVLLSDMWGAGEKNESDILQSKQLDRGWTLDSGGGDFLSGFGDLGEGIEKVRGLDTSTRNFGQHRRERWESLGNDAPNPIMTSDKKPNSILKSFKRGETLYAPVVSSFRGPDARSSFRRSSLGMGSNGTIDEPNGLAGPLPSTQKPRDSEYAS